MIYQGDDNFKLEKGEPVMRSCWECNTSHERLKTVNMLHVCFDCGRYWIFDRFLDSFVTPIEMEEWLKKNGVGVGDSTMNIDKGYRVTTFRLGTNDASDFDVATNG